MLNHGFVVAIVPRREYDRPASAVPMESAFHILTNDSFHPPFFLLMRTQKLHRLGGIHEFYVHGQTLLIDQRQQWFLVGQQGHNRGISGAVFLLTVIFWRQGIMHHHKINLIPFQFCVRLLHHMHSRRQFKHPVKILTAVVCPIVPGPLVCPIAHLLHVFIYGFIFVKSDSHLPLKFIANRSILPGTALPSRSLFNHNDGRAIFRCRSGGCKASHPGSHNDDIGLLRILDTTVLHLRGLAQPIITA